MANSEPALSANIGITTNYVWRGLSQTNDRAAISSGIDFDHSTGWYAGAWTSSLDGSNSDGYYELDLYFGHRFKFDSLKLDLGYIDYRFPVGPAPADFGEVYLKAKKGMFGAGVAYSIRTEHYPPNKNNLYSYISADFEIKKDVFFKLLIGEYDFDDPSRTSYTHRAAGIGNRNFSFTFHKTTLPGIEGDTRWSGSWKIEFDL